MVGARGRPRRRAGGEAGDAGQFVSSGLLGADGPRAEAVGELEYSRLPPQDRGAVAYFRVTVIGRQIPVLLESYLQLPPEQQGPVRFYRREHPRLAEVEVAALGDNVIALTQRALPEAGAFFADLARRFVPDGLMRPALTVPGYAPSRPPHQPPGLAVRPRKLAST